MVFVSSTPAVLTLRDTFLSAGKTGSLSSRQWDMTTFQIPQPSPCHSEGPPANVVDWRRCRLLEAGFSLALATVLARSRDIDVHELLQLVDRGCPPELAARILAPLGVPA